MTVRLPALLLALALGALCAFAVSCGEERTGLISASRADSLREDLDAIDEAVRAGRCEAAKGRLASLRKEVQDLPGSVDADLRRELRDGVTRLEEQAPDECELGTETTETTETTQTTETVEPPVETAPETVPEETTPQTQPQETTPQETTPQQTQPPAETTPSPGAEPAPEPEPDVPADPGGEEAPGAVIE
jgi:hypothetical protein